MSQVIYQAQAAQSEYGDYQQSAMYIPVSGLYYQNEAQQGTEERHGGVEANVGNQMLVEQQDGTLLLYMDGAMPGSGEHSMEEDGRLGSHLDVKFCKQEMDFLHENYEASEGASMPRSIIYNQYRRYCRQQLGGITPMNPASFGKLIRLVFAGIKTRRLGTRGNSKYHYYGIRLKASSILAQLMADNGDDSRYEDDEDYGDNRLEVVGSNSESDIGRRSDREGPTALQLQHQQFLGDTTMVVLDFGSVKIDDNELLPEGITVEHLSMFETMYHTHCEELLEAVKTMQLAMIPEIWQQFWSCPLSPELPVGDDEALTVDVLKDLGCVESLQKYVRQADYAFYTILIDILIPDVLRPIPNSLTLVLRNFAKSLESWLDSAMTNVAKEMVEAKKAAANAFAQLLRRYTGLNHLAQAARTILQNRAQVNRMLDDLVKVDFVHIQEQASWVCQCDDILVHQVQAQVKKIFQSHYTLEQWASWLDDVTTYILQEHVGTAGFSQAARRLILVWTFYSSMVLRDLTLRSASSFGAFHLIRLLFDEYISYTIEHKVAAATGVSSVAAFGDIKQFIDFTNVQPLDTLVEQSAGFAAEYADDIGAGPSLNSYAVDENSQLVNRTGASVFGLGTQSLSYIDGTTGRTTVIELQQQPNST